MGGPVYIHQSRLNPKAAFHGGPWDWHQDYATWSDRDGLKEPRAFMVADPAGRGQRRQRPAHAGAGLATTTG